MKLLRLVLLFSIPAFAQRDVKPSPAAVAESLWQQFETVAWGSAYLGWQRGHASLACRQFPQGEHPMLPDELWSYRCEFAAQPLAAEWLFYALTLDDPITPRLEMFQARVGGVPASGLEELRQDLIRRLSSRYGASQDVDPRRTLLHESGSLFWRNAQHWRSGELEIYLYLVEVRGVVSHLELKARRRPLLDARDEFEKLQDLDLRQAAESGTPLDSELAKQLGAAFPKLPALLAASQPDSDQNELRLTLMELLQAGKTAPPERRSLLLLAADRVAGRLDAPRQSPQWEQQRTQLAAFGLHFEWDELGGGWTYDHGLAWKVWQDYPGTAWGEQAFLLLESHGWDTRVGCQAGSDQFRQVIQNGERFLQQHPRGRHRPEILLNVAQAYETWWSLSKANGHDDYVEPANYQAGAEPARQKAIQLYQQLFQTAPGSPQAAHARQQLPRLKLGIDTLQRRFFCIYD